MGRIKSFFVFLTHTLPNLNKYMISICEKTKKPTTCKSTQCNAMMRKRFEIKNQVTIKLIFASILILIL